MTVSSYFLFSPPTHIGRVSNSYYRVLILNFIPAVYLTKPVCETEKLFSRPVSNKSKREGTIRIISEDNVSVRDSMTRIHGIVTPDTLKSIRLPLRYNIKINDMKFE